MHLYDYCTFRIHELLGRILPLLHTETYSAKYLTLFYTLGNKTSDLLALSEIVMVGVFKDLLQEFTDGLVKC